MKECKFCDHFYSGFVIKNQSDFPEEGDIDIFSKDYCHNKEICDKKTKICKGYTPRKGLSSKFDIYEFAHREDEPVILNGFTRIERYGYNKKEVFFTLNVNIPEESFDSDEEFLKMFMKQIEENYKNLEGNNPKEKFEKWFKNKYSIPSKETFKTLIKTVEGAISNGESFTQEDLQKAVQEMIEEEISDLGDDVEILD